MRFKRLVAMAGEADGYVKVARQLKRKVSSKTAGSSGLEEM